MARPIRQADCHPDRKHCANGLCRNCYMRERRRVIPDDPVVRARYRRLNRDRINAYKRAWAAAHPESRRAMKRREYERHKDRYAASGRSWRSANPDRAREAVRRYGKRHPDRVRAFAARARAYRSGAVVRGPVSRLAVLELADGTCAICGGDVDPRTFHLDHIVPLASGGWHDYDNVQLTHPICNLRKGSC